LSLEFLGFTIDYAHKGGAGGLDLFCLKPYALVDECKAGKSIPNTTAVQLLNLGTLRLKSQVEKYIAQVETEIGLRSQIVQAAKQLSEPGNEHLTVTEIRVQYNAMFVAAQSSRLDDQSVHDLLVELSSPLTGYLGRIRGSDRRRDRFYFLRDLPIT
jgi:hypothetical protein